MQIKVDTQSQEEIRKAIKVLQLLLEEPSSSESINIPQEPKKEPDYDMSQVMTY